MTDDTDNQNRVLDTMLNVSWDMVKCIDKHCLRASLQRCQTCKVDNYFCSQHYARHLKKMHRNTKEIEEIGPQGIGCAVCDVRSTSSSSVVCEKCTDFKVEFYCSSCSTYQCHKCGSNHMHPVFPVAGARGLCNFNLQWSNDLISDVQKYYVQYKPADAAPSSRQPSPDPSPPPTPVAAAPVARPRDPRQPVSAPPVAPPVVVKVQPEEPQQQQPTPPPVVRPKDPRQQMRDAVALPVPANVVASAPPPMRPTDPRQHMTIKREVVVPPPAATQPPVATPIVPVVAPPVVPPPLAVKAEMPSPAAAAMPLSPMVASPFMDDMDGAAMPLPHVGENYLKGAVLESYNTRNDAAMKLENDIRKLASEVKFKVNSQSMQDALAANKQRNALQQQLERLLSERDEAVARVILYDPATLAKYTAAHDPASPSYKQPVNIPAIVQRFVPMKHGQCAKCEAKIQALQKQRVRVQKQIDDALAQHDIQGMEKLQGDIDALDVQMLELDAQRGAEFVEISLFSERVRLLVKQFREEQGANE
ncbi:Aste57867_1875 [Aphanomyces stellatus]|uniref:Aste57867_1875 protein n=1 Tax=Aphanomyces stellatus TaxID=120398 RepID=A0A485K6C2_9STRA|nr:hypothetical protein As57867_001873 [Aphanomyces stellatus]VFT79082.1 Aste57867_1875 [Aphanomyces stellatus]